MAKYDPAVIQKFADRLYSQANSIVATCVTAGAIVGLLCGLSVAKSFPYDPRIFCVVFAVIGGMVGYFIGQSIALSLRMRAQVALCQRQIEYNTRPRAPRSTQEFTVEAD